MSRREFVGTTIAAAAIASTGAAKASPSIPQFSFHSDFYVNLHHTLYRQAGVLQMVYQRGAASLPTLPARIYRQMAQHVPVHAQAAWYRALAFYQNEYGGRVFVFDDEMNAIENAVADGSAPAPLRATLNSVAPIYRESLWPLHDAANRESIAQWQAELARFGASLFPALGHLYQRPWLPVDYRVDVVADTDRDGAFSISGTRDRYWHIVTSSYDRTNAGLPGFETIAHEASHSVVGPDAGPIAGSISAACTALDRPEPSQLWHAVIMYMPGAVLQRLAARAGTNDYTPAFVVNGVFTQVFPRFYAAFTRHLQPYVDGGAELAGAMRATVAEVVSA